MRVLLTIILAGGLGIGAIPAQAQRGSQASQVDNLIEQLQPAGTRGIRMPAATPDAPRQPEPAPRQAAGTTAPAGVPAASITVRFPTASADLTAEAERQLSSLGRALSSPALAPYRFRIEGHTDTVGNPALNQTLSERRAAAVRDHLAKVYGINPARLEAVGLGTSQLLVPTPDQVPEARNRRVQVLNLGG